MNTILATTDLSRKDEKLINRGLQFAAATDAKLHILHVHYTLRLPGIADNSKEECGNIQEKIHNLIKEHPSGSEVEYKIHIADGGRVYEKIDKYAQYIVADLVIMGASETSDNTPDFVLSKLERLLIEASYPVLVVTQDVDGDYADVAIHASHESTVIEAVNILSPVMQNNDVTIRGFLGKPIKDVGFLMRLRQKYRQREYQKMREAVGHLLDSQVTFLKYRHSTLSELSRELANTNVNALALESLNEGLFRGNPEPELREVLANPPCDILMIGRG